MIKNEANNLFRLQTDLIDSKVEVAVSKVIDRVVDQIRGLESRMYNEIHGLRSEMHGFRDDMNKQLTSLDNRVVAIETHLGVVNRVKYSIFNKGLDFVFKTLWAISAVIIPFILYQFLHLVAK